VKKILVLIAVMSIMLFGTTIANAAMSQIDNLPGGAGVSYFQASAAGDVTLFNIQNVDDSAVMVHIVVYNQDSEEIISLPIPLSAYDNWGMAISGDGTAVTLSPQLPCFYAGANNGCFAPIMRLLPAGADGFQRGYISFGISRGDAAFYGGDGNGDPRNDPLLSGLTVRLLDQIAGRTAYLSPGNTSAYALNSWMLQMFVNLINADETLAAIGGNIDSIADVFATMFYNCDGDAGDVFPGSDDANGIRLDTWEFYATMWAFWALIADDTNGGGVGDTYYSVFGGDSRGANPNSVVGPNPASYWGRYNTNPASGTNTWLVTVFPANSGPNNVAACGLASRAITGISCDDNEFCPDFILTPDEVNSVMFGIAGPPASGVSGEARLTTSAPMNGFTYTESATFADIYPLVPEGKYVNAGDGFIGFVGTTHVLDPLVTEMIQLSIQLSHP
jgi:hypothetical protein